MTEHILLRQLMRQQSAAVWKDMKKKGNIYEKADIQGRMLGDIGLPGGENLSMQTNAGKNCESNLQTGSTCRVPGAEMEAGSQW